MIYFYRTYEKIKPKPNDWVPPNADPKGKWLNRDGVIWIRIFGKTTFRATWVEQGKDL